MISINNANYTLWGFTPYHTGGGCMAYGKEYNTGCHVLITDNGGCYLPDENDESVIIGIFDSITGDPMGGDILYTFSETLTHESAARLADMLGNEYKGNTP